MKRLLLTSIAALFLATGAVSTPAPTLAQCESDTVLQQQVAEFNELLQDVKPLQLRKITTSCGCGIGKDACGIFMRQILRVTKYKPGSVN
jgi:hypothetical protein